MAVLSDTTKSLLALCMDNILIAYFDNILSGHHSGD